MVKPLVLTLLRADSPELPIASEFELVAVTEPAQALDQIFLRNPDMVVCDIDLPGQSGASFLNWLKNYRVELPLIMRYNEHNKNLLLDAINYGTFEYIAENEAQITEKLKAVWYYGTLRRDNQKLQRHLQNTENLWLSGASLSELEQQIRSAAGETKILITGERGTEKEAVAERIAGFSNNAACLICYLQKPEDLEDISFLYRAAGGYVAFGDCVYFSETIQKNLKLLLLDNQLDLKFIFLTSAKLRPLVLDGRFDEELYRLMLGKEIYLPPLREREDFAAICQNILETLNTQYGFQIESLDTETLISLSKREWPGNITQLKAAIYLLAAAQRGQIPSPLTSG